MSWWGDAESHAKPKSSRQLSARRSATRTTKLLGYILIHRAAHLPVTLRGTERSPARANSSMNWSGPHAGRVAAGPGHTRGTRTIYPSQPCQRIRRMLYVPSKAKYPPYTLELEVLDRAHAQFRHRTTSRVSRNQTHDNLMPLTRQALSHPGLLTLSCSVAALASLNFLRAAGLPFGPAGRTTLSIPRSHRSRSSLAATRSFHCLCRCGLHRMSCPGYVPAPSFLRQVQDD